MRFALPFIAVAAIAAVAYADDKQFEFSRNPATARMMILCDQYVMDIAAQNGAAIEPAKKENVEKRDSELNKFITDNLNQPEQDKLGEAVKIFNSYYQRDMDMLKSRNAPYSADVVQKICMKHAEGAGKKFDEAWQQKLADEAKAKNAPKKDDAVAVEPPPPPHEVHLPVGTPAISDEARTRLIENLNKTISLIDESLNNKFTSDEEKTKLTEQRKGIEAEIARWQKKS